MTTYPSNPNQDWTSTQAAPWQTSSPDTLTMGAYFPPTSARPTAPVHRLPGTARPTVSSTRRPTHGRPSSRSSTRRPRPIPRSSPGMHAPRAGLRGRWLRRRRGGRPLRCAARVVTQHPGEHGNPQHRCPQRLRPGPGTSACRRAVRAELPVVALVNVERQLLQGGEPSSATSEPASAYPAARSVVLLGSLAVEQQQQLSVELLR